MGKTKICLELFFSICGIKVFIKENSFVHCHTNLHIRRYTKKAFLLTRRYVHDYGGREGRIRFTCLCYNGSWGTDLWPLCRVPPFNNQWLRANFPFSFLHNSLLARNVAPFLRYLSPLFLTHIIKMFFLLPLQIQVYPIFQFESDVWMDRRMEKSYTIFHLIWLGRKIVNLFPASFEHNKSVNNCLGSNFWFCSIQLRLERFVKSSNWAFVVVGTIKEAFRVKNFLLFIWKFLFSSILWRTTTK